jgi:hypothetical protein
MPRQVPNNPIGESIYNRIREYDITSRKEFFKTISAEDKILYEKYNTYIRGKNRNPRYNGDIAFAREEAKKGMKALREKRTKDEISKQRKPYDQKYNIKRRLNREQAATIIQRQFKKKQQEAEQKKEAFNIVGDVLNNIIDIVPYEVKKKKNREAVARHRARAKGEATEHPQGRGRAKKGN